MDKFNSNIIKYAEIVHILEQNNISFNGLVDGLVQTYHNDNPEYKLNQNPAWWDKGSVKEIVDSVLSSLKK